MTKRTILISGSNGLTGSELKKNISKIEYLRNSNIVFANRKRSKSFEHIDNFNEEIVKDLSNNQEWKRLLRIYNPDDILNISNIRHSRPLLDAIKGCEKKPKIYIVGTTAVHSIHESCSSEYKSIEKEIRDYEGEYCIIRPSMIYGSQKDKNMHKVIDFIKKYKFFPIFGDGQKLMQPVYYKDLAEAIGLSLEANLTNISIDIAGAEPQTYISIIEEIFKSLRMKTKIIRLPLYTSKKLIEILPNPIRNRLPVSYEQLIRLEEDKSFNIEEAKRLLNYRPVSFKIGITNEIKEISA